MQGTDSFNDCIVDVALYYVTGDYSFILTPDMIVDQRSTGTGMIVAPTHHFSGKATLHEKITYSDNPPDTHPGEEGVSWCVKIKVCQGITSISRVQ